VLYYKVTHLFDKTWNTNVHLGYFLGLLIIIEVDRFPSGKLEKKKDIETNKVYLFTIV
jgi:hypothetical protein